MRTMGIIKIPHDTIIIRIDSEGIKIDGHLIERYVNNNQAQLVADPDGDYKFISIDDNPANPVFPDTYTYEYIIDEFFRKNNVMDLQFGSMEGKTRSWAWYEYVKFHHIIN